MDDANTKKYRNKVRNDDVINMATINKKHQNNDATEMGQRWKEITKEIG